MSKQAKRHMAGSGETLPAGAVGEVLVNTSNSSVLQSSPVSGTYYGPTGVPVLTLTPGVWLITAQYLIEYTASASVTTTATRLRLINTTDSVTVVEGAELSKTEAGGGGTIILQSTVNISTNKIYKLEFGYLAWSGVPAISNLYGRGDQGSAFIRAVRIA